MTFSRELFRYKLDLVRVQAVRWEGSGVTAQWKNRPKFYMPTCLMSKSREQIEKKLDVACAQHILPIEFNFLFHSKL
jgi:hypothetical protein